MTNPAQGQNTDNLPKNSSKENGNKGPMRDRPLLFLDLETTGLNPGTNEITEIGALLVSPGDFKILETFQTRVMPTHLETASPEALVIGHFDLEIWKKEAIALEPALKRLSEIGQKSILAGFNLTFDWAFLQTAFNQVGMEDPFYYHRYDVMSAAFSVLYDEPGLTKFSLSEMCRFFNVTNRAAHTAFADAEATFEVYLGLVRYMRGEKPVKPAPTTGEQLAFPQLG